MRRVTAVRRAAFTLVELLVAIAVLIALAALALLVVPGVLDQDRTTDGANLLRQYLMISKARAARDQLPRGVRLIGTPTAQATEVQYLEAPPVLIPSPRGGWNPGAPDFHPYVQVQYSLYPVVPTTGPNWTPGTWPAPSPAPLPGTITARLVTINNLTLAQVGEITGGSILVLPDWGVTFKLPPGGVAPNAPAIMLASANPANASLFTVAFYVQPNLPVAGLPTPTPPGAYDVSTWTQVVAQLDGWMGASTQASTFHVGLYGAPRPLVGEPIQPLPKNICVDLISTRPQGAAGADYDVVFAPNGQVMFFSQGQINLWVRDMTKGGGDPNPPPVGVNGNYATGGEQQVVSLKTKSGSLGVFPIAQTVNPFQYAQQWASAPAQ